MVAFWVVRLSSLEMKVREGYAGTWRQTTQDGLVEDISLPQRDITYRTSVECVQ